MRLDFNENTAGCSPRVRTRLRQLDAETLARYPEREPVERVAAQFLGLHPEQVLLTNGVDEALHLLAETYLEEGDEVILVEPTFAMYEIYARATGATVRSVPYKSDFEFPTGAVLDAITPKTRMVFVANPNNPTGTAVERQDLLKIASAASSAAVVIDEAYFEFHGETMLDSVGKTPNLLICRTFSKAYGLAALRAGVLVGDAAQIGAVRSVASPYNVNGVALAVLPEALADQEYVSGYIRQVRRGREALESELASLGVPYWPSHANFVLANCGAQAQAVVREMRERGILVRDRERDPGCSGCVRMTLGSDEDNGKLLEALREIAARLGLGTRALPA